MPRIGYAGGVALELFKLRARNAELEPIARRAKNLQSVVDDLARENLELRREVYRQKDRRRQSSGPRKRCLGVADRNSADLPADGTGMAAVDQQGAVT